MAYSLSRDLDMIEVMEKDLITKTQAAFSSTGDISQVMGVFSLDEVESIKLEDLCGKPLIAIGYKAGLPQDGPRLRNNSTPAGFFEFDFGAILCMPVVSTGYKSKDASCKATARYKATRLLTIMRMAYINTPVAATGSTVAINPLVWGFVMEAPLPAESSEKFMYYTQVWRLTVPIGKLS